ncbi:NAD(P)H-dependent oxidoreductase [Oxalobacteraceae bacterium OTU3CINTB1]|nr:NAD(P)H-dependent oxidoreductase [Oxalobacteraceae bacterium OTU3CINTB1]
MDHVLVINSSASGSSSVSRDLVDEVVQRIAAARPGTQFTHRDVDLDLVPHLTATTVAGVRAVAGTEAERATQTLSDTLIAELAAADAIVIGAPMYNFSIPSSLRTWFDHVLRPRVTFSYGAGGPTGLLINKRAIVVESRGGVYSEGPSKKIDFQEPYLKQLLGFIGISDVTFIRAEKIGFGPDFRELALAGARVEIAGVVDRIAHGSRPTDEVEPMSNDSRTDYDAIMQANLASVFNEHDPARRIEALGSLYHPDAQLYERDRSVQGHGPISQAVTELLDHLPAGVTFRAIRPAVGHHGAGRLQWSAVAATGAVLVTGTDVASIRNNLIQSLHVFLDQGDA